MDKNKFEKAHELDKNIHHLKLRLEKLSDFKVNDNTSITLNNDRETVNVYGDKDFINTFFESHKASLESEITKLQSEFNAL